MCEYFEFNNVGHEANNVGGHKNSVGDYAYATYKRRWSFEVVEAIWSNHRPAVYGRMPKHFFLVWNLWEALFLTIPRYFKIF